MERELCPIISTTSPQTFQFPPGFRFHPSDEELIVHYLHNKVTSRPLPASVATDIDLYKYNPWELPTKALFGEGEWYFFSPRERKYPKGERPNRAAGLGYWKATGIDQPIFCSFGSKKQIGVKKSLVFYAGRPPKGEKTDWLMNEYRLLDSSTRPPRLKGSMKLDDWVLCRIRCKGNMSKNTGETQDNFRTELLTYQPNAEKTNLTSANHDMINDYMSKDPMLLAWIISDQLVPPVDTLPSANFEGSENGNSLNNFNAVNSHIVSPIDSNFSLLRGKTSQEQDGDSPSSMALAEANIYGYNQNQSRYDVLNANYPMDSIDEFQGLNELALTGRFLR